MIPYAQHGIAEIKLLDSASAMDFDGDGSAELVLKAQLRKEGYGLCEIQALAPRCDEYESNKASNFESPDVLEYFVANDLLIGYSFTSEKFLGEFVPNSLTSPEDIHLDNESVNLFDDKITQIEAAESNANEASQAAEAYFQEHSDQGFQQGVYWALKAREYEAEREYLISELQILAVSLYYIGAPDLSITAKDYLLDLNSDGLSDHVSMVQEGPEAVYQLKYRLNFGGGRFGSWIPVVSDGHVFKSTDPKDFAEKHAFNFADLNYDGHADFIWHDHENQKLYVKYWQVTESRFSAEDELIIATDGSTSSAHMFFDVGGDGAIDYIRLKGDYVYTHRAPNQDVPLDVITSITTGIGAKTLIEYSRLNEIVESPGEGRSHQHYFRHSIDKQSSGESCPTDSVGLFCERYTHSAATELYGALNANDWGLPDGSHSFGKDSNCDTKPDPVLELNGAMPIVAKVKSSSPAVTTNNSDEFIAPIAPSANYSHSIQSESMASISYYYGEARVQAMGRGMLGFESLMTVDNQTGVATSSTYRQDFPFIGLPLSTEVRDRDGNLMSSAENRWRLQGWSGDFTGQGLPNYDRTFYQPYIHEAVEKTYEITLGDEQGSLLSTVTTYTEQDNESNVTRIETVTESNDKIYKKLTENSYSPSNYDEYQAKVEGRLSETIVTTIRIEGGTTKSDVRKAQFEYYSGGVHRGMLSTEVVEPDNSILMQTRQHSYDNFGNLVRTSLSAGGETRCNANTKQYDPSGRYIDKTFDCKGRILSEIVERNVYGSPTKVLNYLDTNSTATIETRFAYTPRGVRYFQADSSGTWEANTAGRCDSGAIACPSGAVLYYVKRTAGGGESRRYTDVLGREIRQSVQAFDGGWNNSDTRYDKLGRTVAVSEPYFDGDIPVWNRSLYDFSGRVLSVASADDTIQSSTYNGFQTTVNNGLGQERISLRNPLGEVISVTDELGGQIQYEYDARGNLEKTTTVDGGSIDISYDRMDRKTEMQDPDKGRWLYHYNSFGELIEQVDAKGQRVVLAYDDLGRKVTRHDYKATGALEGFTRWQYDTAPRGLGKLDYVSYHLGSSAAPASYQKLLSYDSLGRLHETVTSIGENGIDGDHYELVTYDEFGRVAQQFDAARASNDYQNNGVEFRYNDYGYQNQIVDAVYDGADTRRVYQKVLRHDVRGNVIEERLGNGITRTATHNSVNGRLTGLGAKAGTGSTLLALDLTWDAIGNLTSRQESGTLNGNYQRTINETYIYDRLNRLTDVSGDRRITAGDGSIQDKTISLSLAYYLNGNIKSKSDVGNYQYTSSKPHAVTMAGGDSYNYDANGNNTSGAGRTISYSTFDKPIKIESGSNVVEFAYGPSRQRYKRLDTASSGAAAGITQTLYLGSVEKILRPNGEREWKRYIGGSLIVTQTLAADNTITDSTEDYLLKDHLGSVNLITDQNGAVKQWFQYDAFGQRLLAFDVENLSLVGGGFNSQNSCANGGPACSSGQLAYGDTGQAQDRVTTRGFTGHETIASMGIIHMNGRIYDPRLGRFLQADPFVDGAWDTQGYNRYSYVQNNPLNAVDPSGYSSWTSFRDKVLKPIVRQIVTDYVSGLCGYLAAACAAVINAAWTAVEYKKEFGTYRGSLGPALNSGVQGYFSGNSDTSDVSSNWLSALFNQGPVTRGYDTPEYGAASGILLQLAPQTAQVGSAPSRSDLDNAHIYRSAQNRGSRARASTIGATSSSVTGGKYVNGAGSGAFSRAVNDDTYAQQTQGSSLGSYGPLRTAICNTAMQGCTPQSVYDNGLRILPGPGGDGTPIENGAVSELFVGPTQHFFDDNTLTVRNVALTDQGHILSGVVTRQVTTDNNGWVYIETSKVGPATPLNVAARLVDGALWRDVDLRIRRLVHHHATQQQ